MKNGKRAVSFILAVVLLCTSFAGCGMVQQDKAYLEQVAAAVTEAQSILKDVEAAADELSGQSSIVYENSVNAEGFDVLDEYYTLCTEKLNALNDAVGAVRQQMQSLERCDAPKTEKGKAVEAEQKAYFEDALEVISGIQEALTFYTAQYDALQPLVTATVGDRSDEQAYLISVYEAAGIDPDEETAESKTEASSEASNAQTEPEVTPEPEVTVTPEPTAEPTPEATYTLVDYDGGVFTMQLPQGWQIMTGGEYAGYSIRAWDPNDPDVQIFYYGELGPYFKSAEAKAQYQSMSTSNDPLTYLPVLEDPTLAGCLNAMDDYQDAYDGIMPQSFAFAKIQNMTVLSETPITTPLASYAVSEASILASLTSETGAACTGMFEGSILDAGGYEINGVDVTPSRSASNIFGIIAPEGKFETVAPILIQSLTSFTFTDEYIQEAIRQGNMQAENAAEVSRRNSEMMERVVNDFCEYIRQ